MTTRLLYALFLVAVFFWVLAPPRGYDIWFYMTVGRAITISGEIPHPDIFLGTADKLGPIDYVVPEWCAGLFFYAIYQLAGPAGLGLSMACLLTALAALALAGCRAAGLHPLLCVGWVGLGMLVIRSRFMLRTVLFTDVMLALLILVLLSSQQRPRRLLPWACFPLFLIWSNLHQGVVSGLVLLILWTLGEAAQRRWHPLPQSVPVGPLLAGLGLATVATFIRPGGLRFLDYLHEALFEDPLGEVLEWAPISPGWWWTPLGPYVLLLVLAFGGAWAAGKLRLPHLLVAAGFVVLAFRHQRALGELMATATPLAAPALVASLEWLRSRLKLESLPRTPELVRAAPLVLLAALAAVQATRPGKFDLSPEPDLHPLGVVAYLERHPLSGQVINSYEFGSFLAWSGIPPFVHGQTTAYPESLLADYLDILNDSPRREELLQRYEVTAALLHYPDELDAHRNFLRYLRGHPDWHLVWFDDAAMLYVRGSPPTAPLTAVDPASPDPFSGGDLTEAESELRRLLEEQPDTARAWLLLAELELRRKRWDAALAACDEVLARRPDDYRALLKRGALQFQRESYDAAVSDLSRCVQIAPESPIARYNLALAYLARARQSPPEGAERELRRALRQAREASRLDPKFEPARKLAGQLEASLP